MARPSEPPGVSCERWEASVESGVDRIRCGAIERHSSPPLVPGLAGDCGRDGAGPARKRGPRLPLRLEDPRRPAGAAPDGPVRRLARAGAAALDTYGGARRAPGRRAGAGDRRHLDRGAPPRRRRAGSTRRSRNLQLHARRGGGPLPKPRAAVQARRLAGGRSGGAGVPGLRGAASARRGRFRRAGAESRSALARDRRGRRPARDPRRVRALADPPQPADRLVRGPRAARDGGDRGPRLPLVRTWPPPRGPARNRARGAGRAASRAHGRLRAGAAGGDVSAGGAGGRRLLRRVPAGRRSASRS